MPGSVALGCLRGGRLAGFGVARRGAEGFKIGPLFADDLRIESAPPGATVEIDGKVVGTTPYTSKKLPGGYFHKTRSVFGARL